MRLTKALVVLAVALALVASSGHAQSLNPLFTEPDLIFDSALVGTWSGEDCKSLAIQKSGGKGYKVICRDRENHGQPQGEAHLVRLGDFLFFDVVFKRVKGAPDPHAARTSQAHWFFRIWTDGDVFRLAELNEGWLEKMIDHGKADIGFERLRGDEREKAVVLIASPKDLQTFFREHAGDEGAFPDFSEFHRRN